MTDSIASSTCIRSQVLTGGNKNLWLGDFAGPLVCGADEAGRGPLAGPVVAAAVILPPDFDLNGIDDSKALTSLQREKQRARIMESDAVWAVSVVAHAVIDRINILQASLLAMRQAVKNLEITPHLILVDGHLTIPELKVAQQAVIGGDKHRPCISAASIMAKTYRDELMREYARQYPGYGFEKHKGYPTPEHISILSRLGPCPIHRRTFNPVSLFFGDQ